jgi:signal peptidase I
MRKGFGPFKLKKLYFSYSKYYKKHKKGFSEEARGSFEEKLQALKSCIVAKDLDQASLVVCEIEQMIQKVPSPGLFKQTLSWCLYICFTLLIVIVLRSMVVELMHIPTGSMRPTLREQDNLVTGKTSFGINIPFYPGHFYFNEDLVKRSQIAVWSGKGMDIPHSDTRYFFLFPGKKQYVKRVMGKGGDTLYFYGGKLYGVDQEGRNISHELQPSYLSHIDHVPYISFNGDMNETIHHGKSATYEVRQMNEVVGSITARGPYSLQGSLAPEFKKLGHLYNLWGFKNYGMSRILNKKEYVLFGDKSHGLEKASDYYLEILHHPNFKGAHIARTVQGYSTPSVGTYKAYIPLTNALIMKLKDLLYTARFVVKNGKIARYGQTQLLSMHPRALPSIEGLADGTYEYYYGKAYKIYPLGVRKELDKTHKLMQLNSDEVVMFYNLGIECSLYFCPKSAADEMLPSRYVYFRDGDLITMNGVWLNKADEALTRFNAHEKEKADKQSSYVAFRDYGPPLKEGKIDTAFIKQYGFKLQEKQTLMLGDNYAMSSDSRSFGPVPYTQLKGSPLFVFFPPSDAFKWLPQPPLSIFGYLPVIAFAIIVLAMILEVIFSTSKYLLYGKDKNQKK